MDGRTVGRTDGWRKDGLKQWMNGLGVRADQRCTLSIFGWIGGLGLRMLLPRRYLEGGPGMVGWSLGTG